MTVRAFLMWVHLALGLTGALFIAVAGVTGAWITFQTPLQRWVNPVPPIPEFSETADFARIVRIVEERFAPRRVSTVEVRRHEATVVRLRDRTSVFVNPHQTAIIGFRPMRFASLENLTQVMRRLHTNLLLGPKGRLLVTVATIETLLLALTGLWLWWRKKQWRFGKLRGSLFRITWDLHNATGFWFLLPVLAMTITGILIAIPQPIYRVAGATPAPWLNPPSAPVTDAGREPATLATILRAADSVLTGETTRQLSVPGVPQAVYAVEKPTATVFLNQFSGAVIEVRPHRTPTAGDTAFEAVEHLHTGELLGPFGQALMTLGSLMLAFMALTGLVLGWKRLMILVGKLTD